MRAIVTGATGFLGARLCLRLLKQGFEVAGVGRDLQRGGRLAEHGVRFFPADLSDPGAAEALRDFGRANLFVHAGGLSSAFGLRRAFVAANVDGTSAALAMARHAAASRFVFISSPFVYTRFADQFDIAETQPLPAPLNAYAETKGIAERLVLAARDLSPIVLRPRAIYGPGDKALLPRLIRAARAGWLPRLRDGRAVTNLTHVDDVVRAILAAGGAGTHLGGEVFNIAGDEALRLTDIVDLVAQRVGLRVRWRRAPWRVALGLARMSEALARLRPGAPEPALTVHGLTAFAFSQTLDTAKARARLNFAPAISFAQGLEQTLAPGEPE